MGESDARGTGLTVATKGAVLLLAMAACSLNLGLYPMLALNLSSIVYLLVAREPRIALGMLAFLAMLGPLYVAYTYRGVAPIVISPIHVFQMWHLFPVMAAACVIFMTPPGMISAALARAHCPRKVILGTLVFLRFFPTFSASWRLLRDALRKRGLTAWRQMLANPLDSYEYVMVPSLMSLVSSADQLSASAVTRAAEAPMARSSYYQRPAGALDFACVAVACVACAGAVIANGVMA